MRHAARKDANHNPIEDVFRQLLGDHVTDTSKLGIVGDLFVSYGLYCCFIEIKRDAKADYTAAQIRFQRVHPHAVMRCETIEQAAELCKLIRTRGAQLTPFIGAVEKHYGQNHSEKGTK